ncbi:hypothetical protein FH972_022893 [Carpinus fangiana]|uniref:Uncharacterized protein n=1 Tax=Carpinus fangiana TaxID=176857 RepID=A0A5N6KU87_9ROSI|nr:hypothetical protein FH972_022893 [Carpinus fangiana]
MQRPRLEYECRSRRARGGTADRAALRGKSGGGKSGEAAQDRWPAAGEMGAGNAEPEPRQRESETIAHAQKSQYFLCSAYPFRWSLLLPSPARLRHQPKAPALSRPSTGSSCQRVVVWRHPSAVIPQLLERTYRKSIRIGAPGRERETGQAAH